jgi:predicted AlkP superfamily pyrophosphatase or phosphodiesterase
MGRDRRIPTQWDGAGAAFLGTILVTLLLVAPTACPAADPAARNVVIISLDGFPAYLMDDPQASLPILRSLAASGATAVSGMHVSNPSVTWPNHTTLMTGVHPERHGVLFNGILERATPGGPVRVVGAKTQAELVRVPLLFDLLKTAGQPSAAINWPCTRGSESLADNFPDVPDQLEYTTPRLKQELADRGLLPGFEEGNGVVRDEIWTEAACEVIRRRMPRLLALHLLNLDATHHRYGPLTLPGYTAAALLDALLGHVLDALDDAGIRDRTVIFVVSDHGFGSVMKAIRPNAILRREGLLKVEGGKIASAKAMVVSEGGIGMVYLTDPATVAQDAKTVRRLFEGAEGIAAVLGPEDFPALHLPDPADHPGMADLILSAKDGYSFSGISAGDALISGNRGKTGSHGYLSTNPKMNGLFVAAGPGIHSGVKLDTIDNVDVAPTIGRILDVKLENPAGRVLTEIIDVKQ